MEYQPVKSLFSIISAPRKIPRSEYGNGSTYPIIDQGQSAIAGYTDDESALVPNGEYILFGDHTRAVKWADYPFAQGADGLKILVPIDALIPRFAYHVIQGLTIPSRGYNRHWTVLNQIEIPVPPLDVQREIVRVLDSFADLEAELGAELEARKAQYAHYRDRLLSRESLEEMAGGEVEIVELGAAGSFYGGLSGKSKDDFADGNALFVPYTNVYNNVSIDFSDLSPVRVSEVERQHELHRGDVLVTGSSETPDDCGMTSVVMEEPEEKLYLNSFCFGWRPNAAYADKLEPGFLKYAMRAYDARKQIVKTANGVTRFNISKKSFARVTIPVPPLSVQKQVVDVLDRFDALTTSLTDGLPAEIEARRQQYEYYRDRLLDFPRKEVAA